MQLENFIQFIIQHNTQLIEGLIAAVVVVALFSAYRSFLAAKNEELSPPGASPSMAQLEETMKKLLEKANAVPGEGSTAATADTAPLLAEIAELKKNLETKQTELEAAKTAAPAAAGEGGAAPAAGGVSKEEKEALEAQLKELQAKLSEYEIISEDIADLSFYKEENAKLQKDLEALKAGGAVAAPSGATAAPAESSAPVAAAPPAEEPAIVGKTRATPEPEPEIPAPPAAPSPVSEEIPLPPVAEVPPAPPAPVEIAADPVVDDDIMKEFAAAVELQKSDKAPATEPAAPAAAAEENVDLGAMDLEKMVAEAEGLDETKAAEAGNALEGEMDPNKLLQEAASMESAKPEDDKLAGQFENFVNKKGGA